MGFREFVGRMWLGYKKNKPGILTGMSLGSMTTGTILAVAATPKALEAIEKKKKEEGHEHLTFAQTIAACWKFYIPAVTAELIGIGCGLAALNEQNKRIGSLMTVANAAENGMREMQAYREFVRQKIGPQKEAELYNQAAQQVVDNNPPPKDMHQELIDGVAPKPACNDISFGRYYYVSYEDVDKAVTRLNHRINTSLEGYVSLNDFYEEIGVERIEFGDRVGWSLETGLIEIPPKDELRYAGTPNGWPCWILEFRNPPQYEYKFFRKH